MASNIAKRFLPLFDRILVQKLAAETKTKGGIMLPEKALGKVLEGTVVAAGPGLRNEDGKPIPLSVAVGDRVLLPEYGGTKFTIDEAINSEETIVMVELTMKPNEYHIYRESDIMGKFQDG